MRQKLKIIRKLRTKAENQTFLGAVDPLKELS